GVPVEHPRRVDAGEPERGHPRTRLEPVLPQRALAREQHRRRAVHDLRRVAGGHDAAVAEGGGERGERLERRVAPYGLVDGEGRRRGDDAGSTGRRRWLGKLDRDDLALEPATVDRRDRT